LLTEDEARRIAVKIAKRNYWRPRVALQRISIGKPRQGLILVGATRGGKTVLLNRLADIAEKSNFKWLTKANPYPSYYAEYDIRRICIRDTDFSQFTFLEVTDRS
jgi:hypothetical protein